MTKSVEQICRDVRAFSRRQESRYAAEINVPFTTLNNVVSKALTGVPYAQAVAAERSGKSHGISVCTTRIADAAKAYGINADALQYAIGIGAMGTWDRESLEYWPFPERERAMDQLMALMAAPLDGRHVILASHDWTAGATTTLEEFMRRQRRANTGRAHDGNDALVGEYLHLYPSPSISFRLDGLAEHAWLRVLDPPLEHFPELPYGKAAIAGVQKTLKDVGVKKILIDGLDNTLRDADGEEKRPEHYLRGVDLFASQSEYRVLVVAGKWSSRIPRVMPRIAAKADIVRLDPIADSKSFREWLSAWDPLDAVGLYDDAMAAAVLSVSGGNLLLLQRYVRDAVMAILRDNQTRDVVRNRIRGLQAFPAGTNCQFISGIISGRERR